MKELTNTPYLVSLGHTSDGEADMKIFDVSKKENPKIIYTFEKVFGGKQSF